MSGSANRMRSGGVYQGATATMVQRAQANPRLYLAMDLLYMPLFDLQSRLEQELSENPFLELESEIEDEHDERDEDERDEDEHDEGDEDEEEPGEDEEGEIDWEQVLRDGFDAGGARQRYEPGEEFESAVVGERHLQDHLSDQIGLLSLDDREVWIAGEIIGNIDDDGLLACSLEEVAVGLAAAATQVRGQLFARAESIEDEDARAEELAELERLFAPYSTAEVEKVLAVVQSLDPPGVGARDMRECLDIQLRGANMDGTLAHAILRDHFDALLNHRWAEIANALEVTPREVQEAAEEIARLDPRPGRRHASGPDHYVVPDLIVDEIDGEYHVFINDAGLPRLRLAPAYRQVAADSSKFVGENKEFITRKLNAANWFLQALEQRRQNMLAVMRVVVERQRDFLDRGLQRLKPLTLREVAAEVGISESTVSRVVNQKHVQTPAGVHSLKFFFSAGLETAMGDAVSTRGVQDRVKSLLDNEDPRRPLTDQAIADLLKSEGIKIARRTVAKYRDQLGILSARMRRRM